MSAAKRRIGARERLIAAAIAVSGERGQGATTLPDVIAQASCARATFYQHFGDFEECFLAAVDRAAGELLVELRKATRDRDRVDAARGVVCALVGFVCEGPVAARLLLLETLGGGPRALVRRDRLIVEVGELIDDSSEPAGPDRRVLALPSAALVGGVFRLLAIRLARGTTDREELQSGLLAWIDAYLTPAGQRARTVQGAAVAGPPADLELSRIRAPSPLRRGEHRVDPGEVRRNERDRILHATIEAVCQYTYAATTVQDIVARAGVSPRAFYRHFPDREHAANEAHELIFTNGMMATSIAFFAASRWPRRVWAAWNALAAFLAANPAMARFGLVEVHAISPAAIRCVYDHVAPFTLFLEEGYGYRARDSELPRLCSEAIAAVVFEFAYRAARRHSGTAELLEAVPALAYVILAPFLGPDEATEFTARMTECPRSTEARADAGTRP